MLITKFLKEINKDFSYAQSIILRYSKCVFSAISANEAFLPDDTILQNTSILEGVIAIPLLSYKDVKIILLDETSHMSSGTFKSLDACLSTAFTLTQNTKNLIFESGGNTGTAFSIYAALMNLRTFFVVPQENIRLLSERAFLKPYNYLIAVKNPQELKIVAQKLEKVTSAFRIPRLEWRYLAAMFRGFRILEYLLESSSQIDWFSQTISAGFGPIGIYKVLNLYRQDLPPLPRFLGVQQAENCPYYTKIQGHNPKAVRSTKKLLIPVMYDSQPFSYRAFEDFKKTIQSGGRLLTINRKEFDIFMNNYFRKQGLEQILEAHRIFIYQEDGEVLDKAGLVGLAGVFKAIDAGLIQKGETVLHSLSSGTFQKKGTPVPDCAIKNIDNLDEQLNAFARSLEESNVYVGR